MQEQSKTQHGLSYSKLPKGPGFFIGNYALIEHNPVAVYCSRKIPLSVFEQSNEVVSALMEHDVVLAGGWQSPMEKRLLKNIKRKEHAKIIYFLAKGIRNFRPFKKFEMESLEEQDRLLVLSLHESEERITRKLVEKRDHWMRKMLQRFFFLYIDPDGKLQQLYEELTGHTSSLFVGHAASLSREKKVFLLNHPENRPFMNDSVILIDRYNLEEVINA